MLTPEQVFERLVDIAQEREARARIAGVTNVDATGESIGIGSADNAGALAAFSTMAFSQIWPHPAIAQATAAAFSQGFAYGIEFARRGGLEPDGTTVPDTPGDLA